jgi:hypothetical protein
VENEKVSASDRARSGRRPAVRSVAGLVGGAALALAVVGAGGLGLGRAEPARLAAPAAALAQDAATPTAAEAGEDLCPDELYGPGSEAWAQAELYFGTTQDDGYPYSEEEFLDFLDAEVTPRFPAGLTLLTGVGQWQGSDGTISQERSQVLVILYPPDETGETSVLLEEIRDAYEQQFNQESVLRADTYPVCTSF